MHITRGLLGLIKSEAQLADVLGHEITHITAKHTVRSIQKKQRRPVGRRADEGRVAGERGGEPAGGSGLQVICSRTSSIATTRWKPTASASCSRTKSATPPTRLTRRPQSARRAQHQRPDAQRPVRVAPRHAGAPRRHRQDHQGTEADRDGDRRSALQGQHHLGRQACCRNHDR